MSITDAYLRTPVPLTIDHIEEDEPGWDCHTMGNHICGTSAATLPVTGGEYDVVITAFGLVLVVLGALLVAIASRRWDRG